MIANWKKNKYLLAGLTAFAVVVISVIFYRLSNGFIAKITDVMLPFTIGLTLAYLLTPLYNVVQRPLFKLFSDKKDSPHRVAKLFSKIIASVVAVLCLIAVFVGLLSLVIPQAYISLSNLIATLPEKSTEVLDWVTKLLARFGQEDMLATWLSQALSGAVEALVSWAKTDLLPHLGGLVKNLSSGFFGAIGTVTDVVVGIIICVYTLNSKETFAAQAKKITYSLFKPATANYIVQMTRYIDNTFGKYISGILLDALMVGVLCFIGMTLFRMPYAFLVSTIVGLFNIVPIFGPIIAAVIGTIFVMLDSPIQAIIFVVFVTVLQQIDGNIVAPRILGTKTGLPGFWVIFAIMVVGGLFGLPGMVLGVPAFAVIYTLFDQFVENRLRKKGFSDNTASFKGLWSIDEMTGEPKYDAPEKEVSEPPAYPEADNEKL